MYFKLAWKNLWRNKKRTLIVSASVFSAVVAACIMRSAQLGSYSYMIESSAKMQTGYLQVQGAGFRENHSPDKSIILSHGQMDSLKLIKGVTSLIPRFEAFALLSNDTITKAAPVVGIDPFAENELSNLDSKLIKGSYLTANSKGILLAEGLARRLKVNTGDSLILLGSGLHGQTAAANLEVTGIVKLSLPLLNNSFSYLSLPVSREIFAAPMRITSLAIMIDNVHNLHAIKDNVRKLFNKDYNVLTWDEMMPELQQSIQLDNASGLIMIGILYLVIAFGILGTIMMMTTEREKEFGILYAVGMKKIKLIGVSVIESVMVSILGVLAGVILSIPITLYLEKNPIPVSGELAKTWESLGIEAIMPFSAELSIFFWQSVIIIIIALICAIYPLIFIGSLNPVNALHK
jgi:ABC-type lipoprotein release transport system permease subunit